TIRFKDASSPQPNIRAWTFGDGGSDTGEIVVYTYSTSGPYKITLTVKKNNSPCTCTLTQWITVS
ncbi:MAG: PKD domain-containing protein, partial [Methanomicrobiales archaeon]|nr:PKD domain-containing protein [Methanomicrobiales archaeon]